MSENPFLRNPKEYKQHMNPLEEYIQQATKYVAINLDIDLLTANKYVREVLKDSDIKDPVISYYEREANFDKFKKKTTLLTYLNTAKNNNEIIVPSFTTYVNSKKINSFQKKFIQGNLTKRKQAKKKMADAKAEGNNDDFIYYNVLQKVLKIFNNSLSGAYAITSTALYNPSAHYTLTSITRSVASIGNAVSEMMISGNRYYKDFDNVMNSLTATITHVDLNLIKDAVRMFKLNIPTIDETFNMVIHSSKLYWRSKSKEQKIYEYISKMSDLERTAVVYVNDFYQITKLNDSFSRNLIDNLSKRVTGYYYDNDYSTLLESEEFVLNLAHHICMDDIRGQKLDYEKMKRSTTIDALVSTVKNINNVLDKYKLYLKAFFGTDIMPIDISDVKDMLRRSIVLSDTDSTCATYNYYVEWFFGAQLQSSRATAVSASVMTINTQVIDHFLKTLSANMGVEIDVRDMLAMKNEFYWPTMTPANVSKHYYAGVEIQEGTVFKELERELKGVHLHANNLPPYFKNGSMKMIDDIQNSIINNEKIDLHAYAERVADFENTIVESLKELKPSSLRNGKIREAKAYSDPEDKSVYRYHTLWNEVFSSKYGRMDEPPYTTYDLPVVLKGKKDLAKLLIEGNGDLAIKEKLSNFTTKNFSSGLKTIKLPKNKIDTHGIPVELIDVIDVVRSVENIMNPFYIILETLSLFRKNNMLIMDQVSV